MKFLAIGFLFALFLSVTLAMTLKAQNVPDPGFRPEGGGPSCHGGGRHGGHPSGPGSRTSTDSSDASTTTGATVTTAST